MNNAAISTNTIVPPKTEDPNEDCHLLIKFPGKDEFSCLAANHPRKELKEQQADWIQNGGPDYANAEYKIIPATRWGGW